MKFCRSVSRSIFRSPSFHDPCARSKAVNKASSVAHRRRRARNLVSSLLIVLTSSSLGMGCAARRVTDFTLISTKNTMLVANAEKRSRRVEGEDCTMTLLGVPNMKTAIDNAIEKAGPGYDALVDGVVWMDDKILFQCYRVEGTPLRAIDAPAEEMEEEIKSEPQGRGQTGSVQTERGNRMVERETVEREAVGREPAERETEPAATSVVPRAEERPAVPVDAPVASSTDDSGTAPNDNDSVNAVAPSPTPDEQLEIPVQAAGLENAEPSENDDDAPYVW